MQEQQTFGNDNFTWGGGGGGEIIGATGKIGRKLEESEERRAQTDHQQRPERVRDREETERETEKRQRLVRKITF